MMLLWYDDPWDGTGGTLTTYRWSGENRINADNFVQLTSP